MLPIALSGMSRGPRRVPRRMTQEHPLSHQPGSTPIPVPVFEPATLSRREKEVLGLIVEGHSNRVIAETLAVSERTVTTHVFHILAKLGLTSRTAAAVYAVRHGLA